jgi:hypothetical protein
MVQKATNPFKPIFGKTPPILIDRESMINEYLLETES